VAVKCGSSGNAGGSIKKDSGNGSVNGNRYKAKLWKYFGKGVEMLAVGLISKGLWSRCSRW